MATPTDPYREQPSTFVVQDRSNPQETRRLQVQDRMISLALGGVLPEQTDPARFDRVLDVACGPGSWLIDLAETVPTISHLVGVDISKHMIAVARKEAEERQVQDRVAFHVLDALRLFDLPDDQFDLVNMRLAISFLRSWEWPRMLLEIRRVTQTGGIIRLTEADLPDQSSSPSLVRLFRLLALAYDQAGRYFHAQANGVASDLAGLLKQQNLRDVQMQVYRPVFRKDTEAGRLFCENVAYLFRTNKPFLQKWTRIPGDYEEIYQQMLVEMQEPDFEASNEAVITWGSNP
jgi:ubiquinone/menaquinone biosynthesis C-methylase UbiE